MKPTTRLLEPCLTESKTFLQHLSETKTQVDGQNLEKSKSPMWIKTTCEEETAANHRPLSPYPVGESKL